MLPSSFREDFVHGNTRPTECSDSRLVGESLARSMAVTLGHFGAMPVRSSRSFGSAFSKFHPDEKVPERAFGHRGAEMFARALAHCLCVWSRRTYARHIGPPLSFSERTPTRTQRDTYF
jgi:hypothetical protein